MNDEGRTGMLPAALSSDAQSVVPASTVAATALIGKVATTKTTAEKRVAIKGGPVTKTGRAARPAKRAKGKAVRLERVRRTSAVKVDPAARTAAQPVAARTVPNEPREQPPFKFTVPEVWRTIEKRNERQGSKLYDVLVCQHAVPANDNRYRVARACPECRLRVQEYADGASAPGAPRAGSRSDARSR